MSKIEQKLTELGIKLPHAPAPVAKYSPALRFTHEACCNGGGKEPGMIFVSGQLPFNPATGELVVGKLGANLDLEQGYLAARYAGLAVLAQLRKQAGGSFDHVHCIAKLTVIVNATPDFTDHPKVADGCSELMASVFGDANLATRAAFGASSLPLGAAVEVEALAMSDWLV